MKHEICCYDNDEKGVYLLEQKTLSRLLKVTVWIILLLGIGIYAVFLPLEGRAFAEMYPEFAVWYWPWLLFLLGTALPVLAALFLLYRISVNIGRNQSFTRRNATYMKWISFLAFIDVVYFVLGNVIFIWLNAYHSALLFVALFLVLLGLAIGIATAAVSHLILKAARLQEENDLTV